MQFRFVDRITSWRAAEEVTGIKTVSFEEYAAYESLTGSSRLPETLMLESLLQLGNWLIMLTSDFSRMGILIRFQRVAYHAFLRPGDSLLIRVKARRYREDAVEFDGWGYVGGDLAIEGFDGLSVQVPLEEYTDPADLKVFGSELVRHGTLPPP